MKKLLGYLDIIGFLVFVTIKCLFFSRLVNPYFRIFSIILPILSSLLVIASISLLFKNKGRSRYLYICNIIISCLLVADMCYFRYYKDIISIPVIKNGILLGAVNQAVKTIIKPYDLLMFLDIILIPIVKRILKHKNNSSYLNYLNIKNNVMPLKFRALSFALVLFVGSLGEGYFINKLDAEQPLLIKEMCNKIYVTNSIGNLNCHMLDIYNFAKKNLFDKKHVDEQKSNEIKEYLSKNSNLTGTKFKNEGKGKNLIIIQVEALQQFVINRKINGQEITPNLNRWVKKCMYLDNYYYQVAGGNTSDAEFMTNNSLYPASSGAAYYIYSGDEFNSLPKVLHKQGYYSAAFHGYKEDFWNRNAMYVKEGFDKFYGQKSFKIDEKIGLGLTDRSFFKQSLEKMKNLKQPYYSFLVTLTSHFPFEATDKYGNFNVGQYEGTFLGNYLKAIHYTDKQIGMFLDELEKNGTLDNSILFMYGDHFAISKDHAKELYSIVGEKNNNEASWIKYQKIPLLIHFPKDAHKGVDHTTAGQMDICPTICNIFGLENPYMFGRDIFNVKDRLVVFRSSSFLDGKVFYSSSSGKYYDLKTEQIVKETPKLKEEKQNAIKQLDYNDILLDNNLIKKYLKQQNK